MSPEALYKVSIRVFNRVPALLGCVCVGAERDGGGGG